MIKISVLTLRIKLSNFIKLFMLFMNMVNVNEFIPRWRFHLVTNPTRPYVEGEKQ